MPQFRKKSVVVTAEQFTGDNGEQAAEWCRGEYVPRAEEPAQVRIPTLEGVMVAQVGDWIIQGVRGEFYPCRGDIFEETYREVHEDDDDDIVETLRSMAQIIEQSKGTAAVVMLSGSIFEESADEIERLAARIVELVAQLPK